MAADLPDVPENIGEEWTNPETGIVYEWNGKRWVAKPNEISLDDVAHLSNTQTFTGSNTFENKTYFKSGDDSHRLYMKDNNNTTNLTIFPTGNITSRGGLTFNTKGIDNFDNLHSARIKVNAPDGWDSNSHDPFGFYIDLSSKNTFKNRFVIGGRGNRQKIFEVYDDGAGHMHVYGSAGFDENIKVYGDITHDKHATTKEYVDGAVSAGNTSWGLQFNYINSATAVSDGRFIIHTASGQLKFLLSYKTADGIEWYDQADMALKNLDFVTAGGPGPMYTIRKADDPTKIMRQGFLKSLQYTGNYATMIVDNNQINTGTMTINGTHFITIAGLF